VIAFSLAAGYRPSGTSFFDLYLYPYLDRDPDPYRAIRPGATDGDGSHRPYLYPALYLCRDLCLCPCLCRGVDRAPGRASRDHPRHSLASARIPDPGDPRGCYVSTRQRGGGPPM
jgi:hypothetical protein